MAFFLLHNRLPSGSRGKASLSAAQASLKPGITYWVRRCLRRNGIWRPLRLNGRLLPRSLRNISPIRAIRTGVPHGFRCVFHSLGRCFPASGTPVLIQISRSDSRLSVLLSSWFRSGLRKIPLLPVFLLLPADHFSVQAVQCLYSQSYR